MPLNIFLSLLLGLAVVVAPAQDLLSLEDAIAEALQANYGIQVQRYTQQKAQTNAHPGEANLLPSVDLAGTGQYSSNSASGDQIDTRSGEAVPFEASGIENSSASAQAQVSYTLALASFRQYRVLQTSADLSREQTEQVIEQTALQVATAYYNLAKLANRLTLQREALQRSGEQLKQVENQQEFGGANRLAVLNAQVNLNTDSVNLVSSRATYANARRDLNLLLGREVDSKYDVNPEIELGEPLTYQSLEQQLLETNASLRVAETNQRLAELSLSTTQAQRLPTLSVNGSYAYNFQRNPFSIAPELSTWGPSVSASVNFNLFNGLQLSHQIQNAEVDLASRRTQYREAEQTALRDLAKTYANYRNNLAVLALNQTNLEAAQMNFERTEEAFKLGQASSVELRQAQLNLQQIENQLSDLRFDVKLNEVELLQLSGQLVEE